MSRSIILLEGWHEKCFIKDWRMNHGEFLENIELKVIKPGQIGNYISSYINTMKKVYFVVDTDVDSVNKKIIFGKVSAELNNLEFIVIKTDPEFGAFCASSFNDFNIEINSTNEEIKIKAKEFLKNKDSEVREKKWTYTKILENGGEIKHAKRYLERFDILNFLCLR